MAKIEKLFSKIVMIIFLIMIVLGFTIPGFINSADSTPVKNQIEPRLCQTDADCYLTCDNRPVPVICLENLCQQNECGYSYFNYDSEKPIYLKLKILVDSLSRNKVNLLEKADSKNFFIKFLADDSVIIYSNRLSLSMILSKIGMALTDNCLKIDTIDYCEDEQHSLKIVVNGQEITDAEIYIPPEGDEILITYSSKD